MALLEIKQLVVDYGIIKAIKGIDMKVEKGSIVAVLGANGAGKTTTIRTLSGIVKGKSGEILFQGENIMNLDAHKITRKGILQSPEGRLIFSGLTVEDNLKTGAYGLTSKRLAKQNLSFSPITQTYHNLDEVYEYFPILRERKNQQASTLSGGEQQMLAIARALMGSPELLLLDEPSLGLAPLIVQDIFRIIKEISKRGTTILIVEQNAYQTLKIADYAYVLELGKIKTEGTGQALLQDKSLVEAYLGTS